MNDNLDVAVKKCLLAAELADESKDAAMEGDARHLLSQFYFMQGNYIKAIEEVKKAIDLRELLQDSPKLASSFNSYGIYLDTIGDYAEALDVYFQSLTIKEKLDDKKGIANTLINVGTVYSRLNNSDRELKMYNRSLQLANEIGDTRCIAYNHLNLGLLYTRTGEYDLALRYLDNIQNVLTGYGDLINAEKAVVSQGTIYLQLGEYDKAVDNYTSFLKMSEKRADTNHIVNSLVNLAGVYLKMNELEKAKEMLDKALPLSEQNGLKLYTKDILVFLSDYYEAKGDFVNALHIYKQHIGIKDELLNINNLKHLEELHQKYDLDKKDRELEIHQLKNVELRSALENLQAEKNRSDELLRNILPDEVADELKVDGISKARFFEQVTIMFVDIKNFTIISQRLSPQDLVNEIDFLFRKFDQITSMFGVEKIKTIGDAYMCAGGIPVPDDCNAENVADAALMISEFMNELREDREMTSKPFFEIRIGINTGPVVAGIVGSSKFAYDIWGDAVNTAARMEQSAEAGTINISGTTYELLKDKFDCTYRGKINAKNKGEVDMYFLKNRKC